MRKPLVSVIIPVYNGASFLSDAIVSALEQSHDNIEVLVIDDGSTDNTPEICKKYSDKIRYYRKENGGQAIARNFGIEQSGGDLIAFLDSDDIWASEKIEKQICRMQLKRCMWSYTDAVAFSDNKFLFRFSNISEQFEGNIFTSLFLKNNIVASSVIVHRDILKKIGNFAHIRLEDWDLWLRIAEKYEVALVKEELVQYRIHNQSSLRTTSINQKLESKIYIIKKAFKNSPHLSENLFQKACSNAYFEACKLFLAKNEKANARKALAHAVSMKRRFIYYLFFIFCVIPMLNIKHCQDAHKKCRMWYNLVLRSTSKMLKR